MAVSLAAGLLFGLIPVFKYAAPNGNLPLRAGGRSLSHSKQRHRARNTLVVVQTALAVVLRIREGMKDPWREIVGVVGDVRHDGADQKASTTVYWPAIMDNFYGNEKFLRRGTVYAIRTDRAGSDSLLTQIRQVVWSVTPDVPIVKVRTMEEVYRDSMARGAFTLVMLGIAGGMALLLGIVGIYGVISYSVSQRTRELGIRIALGAGNAELRAMVVGQGVLLAGIGIGVGLAAAGLLGAAAIASYLPVRRASSINPVEALRME